MPFRKSNKHKIPRERLKPQKLSLYLSVALESEPYMVFAVDRSKSHKGITQLLDEVDTMYGSYLLKSRAFLVLSDIADLLTLC